MRTLITGGSGFLGSNLALHYMSQGDQVRVLTREATGAERENIADLRQVGVEVVIGDIRDHAIVGDCCQGVDVVHHIAATMREANVSDDTFREVNVKATRQLLEVARNAGVKRFVYCSSMGAMGKSPRKPANEDSPCDPQDIYQITKKEAEEVCFDFYRHHGFPISIVRPADVYGPRDRRLLKLFKSIKKRRFAMIGSGKNEHHMVYIDDMIRGFALAAQVPDAVGQVFIIAGAQSVQLNTLVAVIARHLGVAAPKISVPLLPVQTLACLIEDVCKPLGVQPPLYRRRVDFFRTDFAFDISKAKQLLGYEPQYDIEQGIQKTLRWCQQKALL